MQHLKKIKKKSRIIFFQATYSSSRSRVGRACPSSSVSKAGIHPDRMPFHQRENSHTHSEWYNSDTLIHFTCTSWECGKKQKSPEKTHLGMGRTCKLHTGSGPSLELFFLIIVIMKQCYLRSCYILL